jgi:hypothetical protein
VKTDEAQGKATPRPWEYRDNGDDNGFYPVGSELVIGIYSPANSELIVRAVNNHDKLLEALKELVRVVGGTLQGYGILEAPMKAAEAAIQSVEEKPNAG